MRRTLNRVEGRALNIAEIRQILGRIDRDTPNGARDAAFILWGLECALRHSELGALTSLTSKPTGGLFLRRVIRRTRLPEHMDVRRGGVTSRVRGSAGRGRPADR